MNITGRALRDIINSDAVNDHANVSDSDQADLEEQVINAVREQFPEIAQLLDEDEEECGDLEQMIRDCVGIRVYVTFERAGFKYLKERIKELQNKKAQE